MTRPTTQQYTVQIKQSVIIPDNRRQQDPYALRTVLTNDADNVRFGRMPRFRICFEVRRRTSDQRVLRLAHWSELPLAATTRSGVQI